ncbi:hypothetical protein PHSY_000423 [Pseudozyma hubeiensis SY62]|uniref:Uncharacterized protein n=1 Tax=Pseudozyma hubeiensis (strain SY62) TaxID=1305764 RepID=R9P472_PSEHS|nr:hypothetical protein PHSY_000423 [Pseudozyma hubeiensis SY62]GAC92865.1 hypothetical protein PHSY_000423 [Pseudozyma hubeiensis SY62]
MRSTSRLMSDSRDFVKLEADGIWTPSCLTLSAANPIFAVRNLPVMSMSLQSRLLRLIKGSAMSFNNGVVRNLQAVAQAEPPTVLRLWLGGWHGTLPCSMRWQLQIVSVLLQLSSLEDALVPCVDESGIA